MKLEAYGNVLIKLSVWSEVKRFLCLEYAFSDRVVTVVTA